MSVSNSSVIHTSAIASPSATNPAASVLVITTTIFASLTSSPTNAATSANTTDDLTLNANSTAHLTSFTAILASSFGFLLTTGVVLVMLGFAMKQANLLQREERRERLKEGQESEFGTVGVVTELGS